MGVDERRVLVAGIGNIFLGDDGFGVEVVRRIDAAALPPSVTVTDYGIRGIHLAYDLLGGHHDTLIMVDAVPLDEPPGTLAVLDVGRGVRPTTRATGEICPADGAGLAIDGHGLHPQAVLDLLHGLGGRIDQVLVVGCRPAELGERMGLSEPVQAAVPDAVRLVTALAREQTAGGNPAVLATEGEPTGA